MKTAVVLVELENMVREVRLRSDVGESVGEDKGSRGVGYLRRMRTERLYKKSKENTKKKSRSEKDHL